MMRLRVCGVWLAALLTLVHAARAGVLVSESAEWQYFKGRTEASSPNVTLWRQAGFNDQSWQTGAAPFYYGEPFTRGTLLPDMQNSYSSVFLRKTFTITNLNQIASADLDVKCDDGFIAWLNGKLVASKGPPANVTFDALASANAAEPVEFETFSIASPAADLVQGANILAIQLFNNTLASSDIVFDAQLITAERESISPSLAGISPFPGTVTNLTRVTVTFSEPVLGVDAGDLLINDRPAQLVTGSGAAYTFTFPQPDFGAVQFAWSFGANITDLAVPPNRFDISGANTRFIYDLVDPTDPILVQVHPPRGLTVRELSEIELTFNKPVQGLNAADLRINGQAATNLTGLGSGPFLFQFPAQFDGRAQISWAARHGITDHSEPPRPFAPEGWEYTVDRQAPLPQLVITEIAAANENGLLDQEGTPEDWIELYNAGDAPVNLEGWSLTDDLGKPGAWVFPPALIGAKQHLVVFASAKDQRDTSTGRLHANFKLKLSPEYLGLFNADAPRRVVSQFAPSYPEQRIDYSYGLTASGQWRYFRLPTPGVANGVSTITNALPAVHFSVKRGFFNAPFQLTLHSAAPGAVVRYTLDGRPPTDTVGTNYNGPILIDRTRIVRAAAFKADSLPSMPETHTYLFNLPANRLRLPTLSLVTASNNLYGATGIMESNPRNTTQTGMAWERPVSFEFIQPQDNSGFQIDCGIRIQGGGYIRGLYDYRSGQLPNSKYSFRLYFRGDYGAGKLDYPLFPDIPLQSFDEIVLRAGMNDHSNPFIRDEFARMLSADTGIVASHGRVAHLFLNGVYKGLYNPTERISSKFLQAWHGGGEAWDIIAQMGEVREGDAVVWNRLRTLASGQNPATPSVYQEILTLLDAENFADYLIPHIYSDTDDWPHNNWRAARERTPGGKFRFYMWDAEWSFGFNDGPAHNAISAQLSNLNPPWGTTEIQRLFTRLKLSPEFRLIFADRVHKHFFNEGALTDARIRTRYERLRAEVAPAISGFDNTIGTTWIPQRRRYVTNHFAGAGLLASSNAPVFSQFGGPVPRGFELTMRPNSSLGEVWFTTNGLDPRVPFTGEIHPSALRASSAFPLGASTLIKARTRWSADTNIFWSALSEAPFQVNQLGAPIRFTEIMYNPPGDDAYEFIELQNIGGVPFNLGGYYFDGIDYRFRNDAPALAPGARLVLSASPAPFFQQRYPGVQAFDQYQGSLNNGGELIRLRDSAGNVVAAVDYRDERDWPRSADGGGSSLELADAHGDQSAAGNWQASTVPGGTPGAASSPAPPGSIRFSEVFAGSAPSNAAYTNDWVELRNTGEQETDLSGWQIVDSSNDELILPPGTRLAPGEHRQVALGSSLVPAGQGNTFGAKVRGENLALFDAGGNRVDAVSFGWQTASNSLALVNQSWGLAIPTPGQPNQLAPLSANAASSLYINEILAAPGLEQHDWIELYNADTALPADISGFYLVLSSAVSRLPDRSYIAPGGFVRYFANGGARADDLAFSLPASGGVLVLADAAGREISRLTYGLQSRNVSYGRLPDGAGGSVFFPNTASPAAANYQLEATGVRLNEFMARAVSPQDPSGRVADWIELHNPLASAADLGGMSLSQRTDGLDSWVFPAGTVLPAGGFLRLWCTPLGHDPGDVHPAYPRWPLPDGGGVIQLRDAAERVQDVVEYGAQIADRTSGRTAGTWTLLATPTAGAQNSAAAALGDASATRINEWMAQPIGGDDWLELHNPGALPILAGGFFLTDDPSVSGRTNSQLPELSFIGPGGFILLQADGETSEGPDHLGFSLDGFGETLRLYNSTTLVDEIVLLPQAIGISEGRQPDGSAMIASFPGRATPGAPNALPLADSDRDGMPDDWERANGLDPGSAADAALDPDRDGLSNLEEFRAGTNPRDAASALWLEVRSTLPDRVVLGFRTVAGRSYTLLFSEDLISPNWRRVADVPAGEARDAQAADLDFPANRARFYRLVTPQRP